jgi:hypothetical protein
MPKRRRKTQIKKFPETKRFWGKKYDLVNSHTTRAKAEKSERAINKRYPKNKTKVWKSPKILMGRGYKKAGYGVYEIFKHDTAGHRARKRKTRKSR